jgi:hypothetical protein
LQTCHDCQEEFETWVELAQHIISQKKTHQRKSRIWALKFLSNKDNVKEHKPRMPMSDELKKAVKENVRVLSGEMVSGRVKCPICGEYYHAEIEIEHVQGMPLRDDNGALLINCKSCRDSFRK